MPEDTSMIPPQAKKGHSALFWIVIAVVVLIVLVFVAVPVLVALFSLNVFNGPANLENSCIGQPGFSCSSAILSNGKLVLDIGQGTGSNLQNATIYALSASTPFSTSSTSEYSQSPLIPSFVNGESSIVNITGGSVGYTLPQKGDFVGELWISYHLVNGTQDYAKLGTITATAT
jgi:hypothetical protein